ncbi:Cro/CI family transcriptional regulator [Erwinia tracheiphila]|nr:Cro/CI family transcriptional regulator [Erwinia tracheiphila]UIA82049.1 Cro/CI family transcriptional regulator [Erwinia tracheiphila]
MKTIRYCRDIIMKKSDAISVVGSKAKLARLLKVTKGAVSQWGEDLPELRALQLEKLLKTKKSQPKQKA